MYCFVMKKFCTECQKEFKIKNGGANQCSVKCFLSARMDRSNGPNACWHWTGPKNKTGYGVYHPKRNKTINAHRIVFQEFVCDIPDNLVVRHTCDNRSCVNPHHLLMGTHKDNTNDMISRGRHMEGRKKIIGENTSRAKLTEKQVLEIRSLKDTQVNIAKKYGMSRGAIRLILDRTNWSHI